MRQKRENVCVYVCVCVCVDINCYVQDTGEAEKRRKGAATLHHPYSYHGVSTNRISSVTWANQLPWQPARRPNQLAWRASDRIDQMGWTSRQKPRLPPACDLDCRRANQPTVRQAVNHMEAID